MLVNAISGKSILFLSSRHRFFENHRMRRRLGLQHPHYEKDGTTISAIDLGILVSQFRPKASILILNIVENCKSYLKSSFRTLIKSRCMFYKLMLCNEKVPYQQHSNASTNTGRKKLHSQHFQGRKSKPTLTGCAFELGLPLSLYSSPLTECTRNMCGASSLRVTEAPSRGREPRGF